MCDGDQSHVDSAVAEGAAGAKYPPTLSRVTTRLSKASSAEAERRQVEEGCQAGDGEQSAAFGQEVVSLPHERQLDVSSLVQEPGCRGLSGNGRSADGTADWQEDKRNSDEEIKDLSTSDGNSGEESCEVASTPRKMSSRHWLHHCARSFYDKVELDVRGNRIFATKAETLWAIGVLKNSGEPNPSLPSKLAQNRTVHANVASDSQMDLLTGPERWGSPTDSNMDLLYVWLQALQVNDVNGSPLLLDPPLDGRAQEVQRRNADPAYLVGAIHGGHKFKTDPSENDTVHGIDPYLNAHRMKPSSASVQCRLPDGKRTSLSERAAQTKRGALFINRGRKNMKGSRLVLPENLVDEELPVYKSMNSTDSVGSVLGGDEVIQTGDEIHAGNGHVHVPVTLVSSGGVQGWITVDPTTKKKMTEAKCLPVTLVRAASAFNTHAGIVSLGKHMPHEAKNYFHHPIPHGGKNFNARTDAEGSLGAKFHEIDAPFIGGASGSILQLILTMEDDCCGKCPRGLVPFDAAGVREALIGIMTAVLIAGGQHSLLECLSVAQEMGYFSDLPHALEDYGVAAEAFEKHMIALGVVPKASEELGERPLSNLRGTTPRQLSKRSVSSACIEETVAPRVRFDPPLRSMPAVSLAS